MKVRVCSDKFVTENNLAGVGVVDLSTVEGISIFGGKEAADNYLREHRIQKQIYKTSRAAAIRELNIEEI